MPRIECVARLCRGRHAHASSPGLGGRRGMRWKPRWRDTWPVRVECVHTYSLIHDDLPAMDNDDFRRRQADQITRCMEKALPFWAGDAPVDSGVRNRQRGAGAGNATIGMSSCWKVHEGAGFPLQLIAGQVATRYGG